jgi:hypothetical protein
MTSIGHTHHGDGIARKISLISTAESATDTGLQVVVRPIESRSGERIEPMHSKSLMTGRQW